MTQERQIAELLNKLLSEPELRRHFEDLGLGSQLPGAGVSHADLCHQAASLLVRRGRADVGFFQGLIDRWGNYAQVEAVAGALGLSGLREPRPPDSLAQPESQARPMGPLPLTRLLLLALPALLALLAWLLHTRPPRTTDTLEEALRSNGFALNSGFSDRITPGTVLRVIEPGVGGPLRLDSPTVWATASDCFANAAPEVHRWAVSGDTNVLHLGAADLARWGLELYANDVDDAIVVLLSPHIHSLSEMQLNTAFSPDCARRLGHSLRPPVLASWFEVVREVIVVDELRLRVRWQERLGDQARLAIEAEAQKRGLQLDPSARTAGETEWKLEGPLVLAWRGATARPVLQKD